MNIINERIHHKTYGEGTVIKQDIGRISIGFNEKTGIKQIIYPDAFEYFLQLKNPDLEISVLNELHEKQAHIEALKLQKKQEDEAQKLLAMEKLKLQKKKTTTRKSTSKLKAKLSEIVDENEESKSC